MILLHLCLIWLFNFITTNWLNTIDFIMVATWIHLDISLDNNCIRFEMWDEITNPFPNFTVSPSRFWNGWIISSHILLGVWSHIYARIKIKTFQLKGA